MPDSWHWHITCPPTPCRGTQPYWSCYPNSSSLKTTWPGTVVYYIVQLNYYLSNITYIGWTIMKNNTAFTSKRTTIGSEPFCEVSASWICTFVTVLQLNGGLEEQLPPSLLFSDVLVLSNSMDAFATSTIFFINMVKFVNTTTSFSLDLGVKSAPAEKFGAVPKLNPLLPT